MKYRTILNIRPLLSGALLTAFTVAAVPVVEANTKVENAAIGESKKHEGMTVHVPEGGEAVTYVIGGVQKTIAPNSMGYVPLGATDVVLPEGTTIVLAIPGGDGKYRLQYFVVKQPVSLKTFETAALTALGEAVSPIPPASVSAAIQGAGFYGLNTANIVGSASTDDN